MKTVFGVSMLVSALLAATGASAQAVAIDGEKIFKQRCSLCHKVELGKTSGLGPNLRGVVGRKAASATGFKYSAALGASAMMWTKPNLDTFIAAPTKAVPGTRMVIALKDAKQRAAVIDYLSKQK
jgi:cytochrome c